MDVAGLGKSGLKRYNLYIPSHGAGLYNTPFLCGHIYNIFSRMCLKNLNALQGGEAVLLVGARMLDTITTVRTLIATV